MTQFQFGRHAVLIASFAALSGAQAQEILPESFEVKSSESYEIKNPEIPDLDTEALRPPPPPAPEKDDESSFIPSLPSLDVPASKSSYTSRNFLGLALSRSNAGVTRGLFKITEDKYLQGKASESAWGMGLVLDLGWSEESPASFRMKWGVSRVRVGLTDELRAEHGPDALEESLNTVGMDFTLRDVLPTDDADLWWGAGFAVRYAWSSSTAGAGNGRLSKLRHSSVMAPLVSVGSDVILEKGHQLLLQADWILMNGYQFSIGLRTQL